MNLKYYKLINNSEFIGIGTTLDLRRFQTKHKILLACDESKAQYIQFNETLYRALWMVPETTDTLESIELSVIEIDKSEYDALFEAIKSGEDVEIENEQQEDIYDVPVVDENEVVTVEYVRTAKIAEMSNICNKVITNGFDAQLSDGNTYHFSLTAQDQLNLITLSSMVASGETAIPYHADGELCKFYSADDINIILASATAHKTYHVSYFNALKAYIEALETIKDISAIEYGVMIPEAYQSDVLKVLIAQQS